MIVIAVPLFYLILIASELASPNYAARPLATAPIWSYEILIQLVAITISFLLAHGYLLATQGQTVGKVFMKTRIVDERSGQIVALVPLFLRRYLLLWLLVQIPFFGGLLNLANGMMIFRTNKKCLHDDLAGTKVVSLKQRRNERKLPDQIDVSSFD